MSIRAPFNFVPLNNVAFFPKWNNQISHDFPMQDGVSGYIDFKMTSESPIFVRNGYTRNDAQGKNDTYKSFSKAPDGKYFIPATTIKGCIRSVLEIMSFGKLSQVDNQSFGLRDLRNKEYMRNMSDVKCGWLQLNEDDTYSLYDWGTPGRISVEAIDKKFGSKLAYFAKKDKLKPDNHRTAKYKYDLCNIEDIMFEGQFEEDVKLQNAKMRKNKMEKRKFYKFGIGKPGVLVFTGQPDNRRFNDRIGRMCGKCYEFVFFKPDREVPINVSDELIKSFKTIYAESPDYKDFWAKRLMSGKRIPVFFIKNEDVIHSIGLSYMYKYPYKKTVFDAIPNGIKNIDSSSDKPDLSECIFGYTYNDETLKGRVQFSHAYTKGTPTPMSEKTIILSSPRPSYYPLYVKNGADWNNATIISGRKRYPVRNVLMQSSDGTDEMKQSCVMLNQGVIFTERVRFFNLKKVELGALLSAITFHGMMNECKHNLGMGKPYGYGKIKISDVNLNLLGDDMNFSEDSIYKYMLEYENVMGDFVNSWTSKVAYSPFSDLAGKTTINNWLSCDEMCELFAMAKGIPNGKESRFSYMKMDTQKNDNEFILARNNREYLDKFTRITGVGLSIKSAREYINSVK
jgi:CRISPR-associated protein (TIGR03986 family)